MRYTILEDEKDCCGCGVCEKSCIKGAICMQEKSNGFKYPIINSNLCIECDICKRNCPIINLKTKQIDFKQKYYAVKNRNKVVRHESTSGGVFLELCKFVINQGGIVFGVKYDNNMKVVHAYASNLLECASFSGSKYVQSDLGSSYEDVKKFLNQGKKVLFSGTPCQIAGLNTLVGNTDRDNLITCDIICHGVPSPKLWKDFCITLNKKFGKVINYKFRDKSAGWNKPVQKVINEDRKQKSNYYISTFFRLFNSDIFLRESCYKCKYANYNRVADITIGDFWGIEKINKQFDDNDGVSAVLINTEKGEGVFNLLKNYFEIFETSKSDIEQQCLRDPTKRDELTDKFWDDYEKFGFEYVSKKYGGNNFISFVKYIIKKILGII